MNFLVLFSAKYEDFWPVGGTQPLFLESSSEYPMLELNLGSGAAPEKQN
jgi:hypothetical protein